MDDSIPSLSGPRLFEGAFLFGLICLLCSFFVIGGPFSALAADQVSFSWRANPQSDNVIGYRLYYGPESRFAAGGVTKSGFNYTYYLDFTDSQRCRLTDSGPVCETYSDSDVYCEGLYGETPKCTLYNLEGKYYFTMTAYNAQAESDYTTELKGYFGKLKTSSSFPPSAKVSGVLQHVYSLLLLTKE